MNNFIQGLLIGISSMMLIEPFIINFVYLKNIDLFNDLFLTNKNKNKLRSYYEKGI